MLRCNGDRYISRRVSFLSSHCQIRGPCILMSFFERPYFRIFRMLLLPPSDCWFGLLWNMSGDFLRVWIFSILVGHLISSIFLMLNSHRKCMSFPHSKEFRSLSRLQHVPRYLQVDPELNISSSLLYYNHLFLQKTNHYIRHCRSVLRMKKEHLKVWNNLFMNQYNWSIQRV